jgi:hypothetical protein
LNTLTSKDGSPRTVNQKPNVASLLRPTKRNPQC